MPGPCKPTAFNMPPAVGDNRGEALPAHTKGASDFTTNAPSELKST